ncbi:MAG: glyceraldehyde-3-phosphate dehydrogenase [Candidatus Proteinoplasmatales archaeon SG8-5]|nr:MAG: glyceraldehyde-3-phosphate dehydrogenase [Candidatus Proteinoplasmatales archaeon SG8-5]
MSVKVAINGYGTIGKRVADAVTQQDDMEIIGVVKRRPTFEAKDAMRLGFPFYAADEEFIPDLEKAGIKVGGVLTELLEKSDIVMDCTPKKAGYKELYEKHNVKAIWQGGEKHELTGLSFNTMANYEDAIGAQFARVVSCNTTGLCRTLYPVKERYGIENALGVMVRRSADPWDTKRGPINAIEPVLKVPSHHGPDVQTVMPDLNIQTTAVKVPTTIMHLHSVIVKLKSRPSSQDIVQLWDETPRVAMIDSSEGIKSTAQIMEWAKDLNRKRGDLFEIAVWKDGVHVVGDTLYYYQAIHQESDVIPENIDCIRAMCEVETDKFKSIEKTDKAMGLIA